MVRLWPGSQGPLEEGQPGALSAAFSGEGYAGAPGLAADPCGTPDLYRSEYLWYTKPLNPLISDRSLNMGEYQLEISNF